MSIDVQLLYDTMMMMMTKQFYSFCNALKKLMDTKYINKHQHNQWLINKVSKQSQKGKRKKNWAMTICRQSISKHKQIIEKLLLLQQK